MYYISRIRLRNIKCFEKLDIHLDLSGKSVPWTLLLGDNASGKSTLLKSIAIGLCDGPSAAGLIKESDTGYIRKNAPSGSIKLDVKPSPNSDRTYTIETRLTRAKTYGGDFENVIKKDGIARYIPFNRIFVCGYAAGRGTSGSGDIAGYTAINAVYNMFNPGEGLQNPELTMLRLGHPQQAKIVEALETLLPVSTKKRKQRNVRLTPSGIEVDEKHTEQTPFRDLADGPRSTLLWVADFLGWAIAKYPKMTSLAEVRGIVLVDEIEQHLHPEWQATITNDLRALFPNVQFITSSHSPIIASGISNQVLDGARDHLVYLERETDGSVRRVPADLKAGMRVDQILASRTFKNVVIHSQDWSDILSEASRLRSKKTLNKTESARLERIKSHIWKNFIEDTQSEFENDVIAERSKELAERVKNRETKLFGDSSD